MQTRPPWIFRVVPALDSLRRYRFHHARADLFAGLTVAAVAVPQAMAYATSRRASAEYGLYTAIVMTAVGALLDSSRQLINGPTNAISIAVLERRSAFSRLDESCRPRCCWRSWSASIQIGITLLRLGDLTRYISHAVIVGFTLGAAVLLVLDQTEEPARPAGRGRRARPLPRCASG